MHRFLAIVAAAMILVVVVVGGEYISQQNSKPDLATIQVSTPIASAIKAEAPLNLTGEWMTEEGDSPKMSAVISKDSITIEMIVNQTDRMAYWYGTFDASKSKFTSVAKPDKLFLASSTTKDFMLINNKISFSVTVMGITKQVALTRA